MAPRRALLVVDLEGVAGADSIGAILAGTGEYERSRALLTAEVNAAVEGFVAAGFEQVRVSDSHLSGSGEANVVKASLHPAAQLSFLDDWYAEWLFEGVSAVACLGMHAPAGGDGFVAHTVDLSSRWSVRGELVSESSLVLGLAAELGVPVSFVSGDDVLEKHLGPKVPFVRTKTWRTATSAESLPVPGVLAALTAAARRPPVAAPKLPKSALTLSFRTRAQVTAAVEHGAREVGPLEVELSGQTLREKWARAFKVSHATSALVNASVSSEPGDWFVEDVCNLVSVPWRAPTRPPVAQLAERALASFLAATDTADEEDVSLRALTLRMLRGHAPSLFAKAGLAELLAAALEKTSGVSNVLAGAPNPDVLQARFDAWYLRHLEGLPHEAPSAAAVRAEIARLNDDGDQLYAWLLGELAARCGTDERLGFGPRHFRGVSRLHDLYWLTHLVLLESDYFAKPIDHADTGEWVAAFVAATPWIIENHAVDLAGEVLFSLQALGEPASAASNALLAFVAGFARADGTQHDPTNEGGSTHATATALVAFAFEAERAG